MNFKILASGIAFAALATVTTLQTWKAISPRYYQAELVKLLRGRSPAAIHKSLSVAPLDGMELMTASHERLISAARVILQDNDIGIELGHFVTRDPNGDAQLACDTYTQAVLRFEADGIAEAGLKPTMEVDGPCRTSDDITRIEAIWIPVNKIVEQKPADMDLSFDDGVRFKFADMTSEWPDRWVLRSVRLYNEADSGHDLTISSREIRAIRERPFILNWHENAH
jgi:hypothetical protein